MEREIEVHADWSSKGASVPFGILRTKRGRIGEIFEFTLDDDVLLGDVLRKQRIDPDLGPFMGAQYPKAGRKTFGMFADASPDRWGRTLIARRFEREKKAGIVAANARLEESDYLLGVHDSFRSGALRFKMRDSEAFLDDRDGTAAPPLIRLRALEAASLAFQNASGDEAEIDEWIRLLLRPGASLGGARPKATVVGVDGRLWMAKFPSVNDEHDVGGWESVLSKLATRAGLRVPTSDLRRFDRNGTTFLVRRFDRRTNGSRIHFASAMTLSGHVDGDDATTGASYLEIAEIIASHGAAPEADLTELWSRIVFNIMVSNTDDHLRNHGFLLDPRGGWRLSDAYDMNPVPGSSGLSLNIDESDNALDLDVARSVARYFRLSDAAASEIVERVARAVATWREVAHSIDIKRSEQDDMSDAFLKSSP